MTGCDDDEMTSLAGWINYFQCVADLYSKHGDIDYLVLRCICLFKDLSIIDYVYSLYTAQSYLSLYNVLCKTNF